MAYETLEATLPAQSAAGATAVTVVGVVPSSFATPSYGVSKLSLTSPTLVTGVATNNATFNFRQMRAGASVGTIGTLTLALGTNLAAETEVNVPITGTPALQDGDIIDCQMVQNGTGLAIPAGVTARAEIE